MNEEQLLRYSRQMMLPEIDAAGQMRLAETSALVIGLGGLGSAASIYLTTGGVSHLTLVDFDKVDLSNLQRQILHGEKDIGRLKTKSALEHLQSLNSDVRLTLVDRVLDDPELRALVAKTDIVIDATDNFRTRFAINRACVTEKKPLVSAAAIRFEAQISVFDMRHKASPCYQCLYGQALDIDETCTENGVIAPLLGIIGSMQALEAMKLIMGVGRSLQGRLLLFDALAIEWQVVRLLKDPNCPVCAEEHADNHESVAADA